MVLFLESRLVSILNTLWDCLTHRPECIVESWRFPSKGWFSLWIDGKAFSLMHSVIPEQLLGELGILVPSGVSEGYTLCGAIGAVRGVWYQTRPLINMASGRSDFIYVGGCCSRKNPGSFLSQSLYYFMLSITWIS